MKNEKNNLQVRVEVLEKQNGDLERKVQEY